MSPSPTSFPINYHLGAAQAPIEIDESEDSTVFCMNSTTLLTKRHTPSLAATLSRVRQQPSYNKRLPSFQMANQNLTIHHCEDENDSDPRSALSRSTLHLTNGQQEENEVIDVDDLEDREIIWVDAPADWSAEKLGKYQKRRNVKGQTQIGVEGLILADVYVEGNNSRRASRVPKFVQRNTDIVAPWIICDEPLRYKGLNLKENKTVQLQDGSMIRIKEVILNTKNQDVKIRGHRLQRVRDLNGLLEKKMNEVVLFLEVDLDDPRDPFEQGVEEISGSELCKLRNVRFTNQKFPACRNIQLEHYAGVNEVLESGGLTARWKYTCIYASASNRYNNIYEERRLERMRADECLEYYAISPAELRYRWRGETIRGGSFRPTIDDNVSTIPSLSQHSGKASQFEDSSKCMESDLTPSDCDTSMSGQNLPDNSLTPAQESSQKPKRKCSSVGAEPRDGTEGTKKIRREVEDTRRRLSDIDMQSMNSTSSRLSICIDLTDDDSVPSTPSSRLNSTVKQPPSRKSPIHIDLTDGDPVRTTPLFHPNSTTSSGPSLPQTIDLSSSELTKPPPSGSIHPATHTHHEPVTRLPGQTLTYGDAFCGAGGTTRGAVMAGLKVLWGFDKDDNACSSWQTNFPTSIIYHKEAHAFVSLAQEAKNQGYPDRMKVDILHLSPPCQFFSPAHTVDGVDDEMNVASLFAVQHVVAHAKPRVVTLEQTFGIASAKFRFYLNSLIQMFTVHDFSLRWAIVPLAQWVCSPFSLFVYFCSSLFLSFLLDEEITHTQRERERDRENVNSVKQITQGLPQRRMRLIVIASCPGEILPRIPPPTHSDPTSLIPGTLPHVSVNNAIDMIPPGAELHDIDGLSFGASQQKTPWDGDRILPRAMTTSGGQNYHPSGMLYLFHLCLLNIKFSFAFPSLNAFAYRVLPLFLREGEINTH